MQARGQHRSWAAVGALVGLLASGCAGDSQETATVSGPGSVGPIARSTPAPSSASATATPSGFAAVVATITAKARAATQNPGLQVYLRQGSDEASLAFGDAVVNPRRAMTPQDRLMVASTSKPMVATAVMRLVERGTVHLDDPVEKWLGDAVRPRTGITVEHLLSMTSGLPDYGEVPAFKGSGTTSSRDLVALVKDLPLQFTPGTDGAQSNTNFAALGVVLERATGRSLGEALTRLVLAPAGMKQSSLGGRPSATGALDPPPPPAHPSAAAGVVSNARDLGRFLTALLDHRLVTAATLDAMVRQRTSMVDGGYGLGLVLLRVPCGTAIGHFGRNDGFAAGAFALRETGRVVAVTANSNANDDLQSLVTVALCA